MSRSALKNYHAVRWAWHRRQANAGDYIRAYDALSKYQKMWVILTGRSGTKLNWIDKMRAALFRQ